MNTRLITCTLAVATGTAAALMPAVASGSQHHPALSRTHTLRFTGVTMKFAQLGKNRVALAEKAVDGSGKVIGFDVVNGVFDPNSNTAKDKYVLSTKGGMLYVDFTFKNQPTTHGKVVGGTGRYKDATGTFTGVLANKQGTRAKVTIRYSTPQ